MPGYIDNLNALSARLSSLGGMMGDARAPWLNDFINRRAQQVWRAGAPGDPGEPEWTLPDGMTAEPQTGGRVTFTHITTNEWVISGDLVPVV